MKFICGLCVIEGSELAFDTAKELKDLIKGYDVDFYFKASFDKANRTSESSFRGIGFAEGLETLRKIKTDLGVKILTDVHTVNQAKIIGCHHKWIDCIQIPAFLCRQTDLVKAIAKTGAIVNIKKGQFLAPDDIRHIIEKVKSTGNDKIMLTERGTCFGYHNLVVDYRSFLIMKKYGYPVIFDCTHSQQRPSEGNESGGSREFSIPMAMGAIACGADGIFAETHYYPPIAKSDKATSLYLRDIPELLHKTTIIEKAIKNG